MPRLLTTCVLLAAVAVNSLAVGASGLAVICLGGGHEHGPAQSEHCESACSHSDDGLLVPSDEHAEDCDCTDIEFMAVELLTGRRLDQSVPDVVATIPAPVLGIVVLRAGHGHRGPPMPPRWFDPGGSQLLEIVSSIRLII